MKDNREGHLELIDTIFHHEPNKSIENCHLDSLVFGKMDRKRNKNNQTRPGVSLQSIRPSGRQLSFFFSFVINNKNNKLFVDIFSRIFSFFTRTSNELIDKSEIHRGVFLLSLDSDCDNVTSPDNGIYLSINSLLTDEGQGRDKDHVGKIQISI